MRGKSVRSEDLKGRGVYVQLSYPFGGKEHLEVERVSCELSVDVSEGVAGGHSTEEGGGGREEGGVLHNGSKAMCSVCVRVGGCVVWVCVGGCVVCVCV